MFQAPVMSRRLRIMMEKRPQVGSKCQQEGRADTEPPGQVVTGNFQKEADIE